MKHFVGAIILPGVVALCQSAMAQQQPTAVAPPANPKFEIPLSIKPSGKVGFDQASVRTYTEHMRGECMVPPLGASSAAPGVLEAIKKNCICQWDLFAADSRAPQALDGFYLENNPGTYTAVLFDSMNECTKRAQAKK